MNAQEVIKSLQSGVANKDFELLYQKNVDAVGRYVAAGLRFIDIFGNRENVRIFTAPGRTEVGGNHTDHQHGRVLAGSVDLDIIGFVAPNNENVVRIKSEGFKMDTISLDELDINKSEYGKAVSLIRGMCACFKEKGYEIGGFDAYTTSNVLKGSGLSSSAAFEVFIGTVLNNLFNYGKAAPIEIAKYAQRAESVYFGKPCGLLDQSASSLGGFTFIDFKDTANPIVENISFDLDKHNHVLCVVNTGGNHANLTQDYADITVECRQISNYFNKDVLRDVDQDEFFDKISELKNSFGDRAVLRAIHFFSEDARVVDEKQSLIDNDFDKFLNLVKESGDSSYKYLQNTYSTSALNEQGINVALALTEKFLEGKGACRVHGGGFAGTIQCYVPSDMIDAYKQMIEKVFGANSCYVLKIRSVGGYEIKL